MSQDHPTSSESSEANTVEAASSVSSHKNSIYLVSYPKIVFMYPTMIFAFIAGIYMQFFSGGIENYFVEGEQSAVAIWGVLFLLTFAINLVVISFDFPRTTSLTLFFCDYCNWAGGVSFLLNISVSHSSDHGSHHGIAACCGCHVLLFDWLHFPYYLWACFYECSF